MQYRGDEGTYLIVNVVTVEGKDGKGMYEMHLAANDCRAEKLSLSCKEDQLAFGKGKLLGSPGVTEVFETVSELPVAGDVAGKYNGRLALCFRERSRKDRLSALTCESETRVYFVTT